jgi:hypothetical protein
VAATTQLAQQQRMRLVNRQLVPSHPEVAVYNELVAGAVAAVQPALDERMRCIVRAQDLRTSEELLLDAGVDWRSPTGTLPAGDAQLQPAVCNINVTLCKMRRRIIMMSPNSALARLKELASGGARLCIMTGSKEDAQTWADVLRLLRRRQL